MRLLPGRLESEANWCEVEEGEKRPQGEETPAGPVLPKILQALGAAEEEPEPKETWVGGRAAQQGPQ